MPKREFESRNLLLFMLITFAWSWGFWLPEILWDVRLFVAPFGPMVGAVVLTYMNRGSGGVKALFKRGIDFKFRKAWLLPILFLLPAISAISLYLAMRLDGYVPDLAAISQPIIIPIAFIYIFILGGPLAEEFGWRGYALDRFQARFSALSSGIFLGVIWGLWHLPLFYMPSQQAVYGNIPIWGFIVGAVLLSILSTWIYNNTGRSILAVLLFHTT
ncbi:MAG: type II CAAX endopeptidase family protein, partial [Thermoplasmata archaeon]